MMTTTGEPAIGGVCQALDQVRVAMTTSKRAIGRLLGGLVPACHDVSALFVVHAVEQGPSAESEEVTVGLVAARLGVDPSHASRLVTNAIRSGLVRRVASQEDGRRSHLELTGLGLDLAGRSQQIRNDLVARAMAGWEDAERAEFGRLFVRFADGLAGAVVEMGEGCPADWAAPPAAPQHTVAPHRTVGDAAPPSRSAGHPAPRP